jgi:hypothetical protein
MEVLDLQCQPMEELDLLHQQTEGLGVLDTGYFLEDMHLDTGTVQAGTLHPQTLTKPYYNFPPPPFLNRWTGVLAFLCLSLGRQSMV